MSSQYRRLDQPVGFIGRHEDLVAVLEAQARQVHGEVVLVRHDEPDGGDRFDVVENGAAHVVEGVLY